MTYFTIEELTAIKLLKTSDKKSLIDTLRNSIVSYEQDEIEERNFTNELISKLEKISNEDFINLHSSDDLDLSELDLEV